MDYGAHAKGKIWIHDVRKCSLYLNVNVHMVSYVNYSGKMC